MASVDIKPNLVPPAALVTFIQKGLQYMEAEANIDPVSKWQGQKRLRLWGVACPCGRRVCPVHNTQTWMVLTLLHRWHVSCCVFLRTPCMRHACSQDAAEIAKEFSMLLPVDLLTKDIDELRDLAAEQRDKQQQQIQGGADGQPQRVHCMWSLSLQQTL